MSNTLKSLGHPIRLEIILLLNEQHGYQFGELASQLKIESSGKLSFHLNKLEDLITKNEDGQYVLNDQGKKAVEALQVMGLQARDNNQPKVEKVVTPERKAGSGFFDQITPAKFIIIGIILGILVIPLFYLLCPLLGAIYYRLVQERGTVDLKKRFNQYLLILGTIPVPLVFLIDRVTTIMDLVVYGGLLAVLLVAYVGLYFIGAWLYIFFSDFDPIIPLIPRDLIGIFREVIILGVISSLLFAIQAIFNPAGFFEIPRYYDITTFMYEVRITVFARFLMLSLLFGFFIHMYGVQFESLAELLFNLSGRVVISLLGGIIVFVSALSYGSSRDISDIDPYMWYGLWIALSLVSAIGTFYGQVTAIKFNSNSSYLG